MLLENGVTLTWMPVLWVKCETTDAGSSSAEIRRLSSPGEEKAFLMIHGPPAVRVPATATPGARPAG
jgi:hypothetical protein